MIKYKLTCNDCDIYFDSWFSSSKEYEKLKKKKLLNCHICNSLNIEKTLMSPNVFRSKNDYKNNTNEKKYKEIKKKISEYQKFIRKNFDYVGKNFAYEARSLHYKDKKTSKGIYGSATKNEIKELKEEGIEAEMIPWIKNSNN
tara:strand:+ start:132 stop:560 length:429 start_codon:yes stop_codon:yes gene_type:complete